MCDLCSNGNDLKKAIIKCRGIAEELSRMAHLYSAFAAGNIKPHTDKAKTGEMQARSLIRLLVDEWL